MKLNCIIYFLEVTFYKHKKLAGENTTRGRNLNSKGLLSAYNMFLTLTMHSSSERILL